MPWKNGGGETIELAVSPQSAAFEDFDWRLSAAHVACDGPFSRFPGVDRTLGVTSGSRMTLAMPDRSDLTLTPRSLPLEFSGELAIEAKLLNGPVDDLNVMTRRGRFGHHMAVQRCVHPLDLKRDAGLLIVSARDANADLETTTSRHVLRAGDFAILDENDGATLRIVPECEAVLYVIKLWRV
jgi:environmental stress-induced protein Ves